ncbi:hypothetical protein PROFUN_16027 [Planoprotostelium fungivorum]|uniref:Uncharacterized protein n=1 Tax=Planoprotostelium fungivorum TaxID=1890364 RepID=A0A2P6MTE2_9EUKA|nr:hypothetical protein PROFUN_16027 [Planoprotostelium fungivorum]
MSWLDTNEFAKAIAELMRKKSSDPFLKILSASYNSSVKGQHLNPSVLITDDKKRYLTCAERNTFHLQPSEFHDNRSIMVYTTLYPCESCSAILMQIIHNVGLQKYYDESSDFLEVAGMNTMSEIHRRQVAPCDQKKLLMSGENLFWMY